MFRKKLKRRRRDTHRVPDRFVSPAAKIKQLKHMVIVDYVRKKITRIVE